MSPDALCARASRLVAELGARCAVAVGGTAQPGDLAQLARHLGRARHVERALGRLLHDPDLPVGEEVGVTMAHDRLIGAYRVARSVALGLARRERLHRDQVQAALGHRGTA